jgi:hypothetical protein
MKKYFLFGFLFIFVLNIANSAPIGFGVYLGLATPNNEINNVYNSDKINLNSNIGRFLRESAKIGYSFGINANLPLSNNFVFKSGIALCRFPQTELKIYFPEQQVDTVVLKSIQNIIPISAGIDLFVFKSVISPYISANLSYNYIVNTLDIVKLNQELPIATSETYSRLGAGVGAGLDFDLEILTLNLEAKYWWVNLIGKTAEEPNKNYLTVTLGVIFGGR